jgi:Flp pilus assembly pilin Flp
MGTPRESSRRCGGDRGASLAEYSMLLTVIAIICVGAITVLALHTSGVFDDARDGFDPSPTTTTLGPPVTTPGDGGGGPVGTTPTVPDCSTTTLPGDSGPDCTTTTAAP